MRQLIILTFVFLTSILVGQTIRSYDYAYEREKGIYVYSISEKKEVKITEGYDPYISPNGRELSYTVNLNKDGPERCIYVMNLISKRKKVLKINSKYCFGAVWSPDGRWIAYNVLDRNIHTDWSVAIIDTANDKPIDITRNIKSSSYSPTWSSDSKSILVQNMDSIFQLNLNGEVINKYKIHGFGIANSDKSIFTDDGENIIYEGSVDEQNQSGFEDPSYAIFIYNIKNETCKRITPVGYDCYGIFLLGNKIFFRCRKPKAKIMEIYSIDLNGNNFKKEFKKCHDFSMKRK